MLVISAGCGFFGCSPDSPPGTSDYLVRIGATVLTEADFNQSFEFQKTAYGDSIQDPEQLKQLKRDIFRELVERAIMLERARETGVRISPKNWKPPSSRFNGPIRRENSKKPCLNPPYPFEYGAKN